MFIKDGDSGTNENLFGKVRGCLCMCECDWSGGGGNEAIATLYHLIFNHVTCLTGLLQVWPTFENVIVNSSLDWDEQTRVGNCLMYDE